MICLRCGYCCVALDVIIVKPEFAKPDLSIDDLTDDMVMHKPRGQQCHHLSFTDEGKASCAIHEYPWYKHTPCYAHTQVERSPDTKCRMGLYLNSNTDIKVRLLGGNSTHE